MVGDPTATDKRLPVPLTLNPGAQVVGLARNRVEVVQKVRELLPDVIIMDLWTPGGI